jgi:DNA invertase Pin-like site-specific DNA recombinase
MKTQTRRAAVYARIATTSSLLPQNTACEDLVRSRGWTLVANYTDARASGATLDRMGLTRLLSDVAGGRIDVVVVHDIARLSRSTSDLARILALLGEARVGLVSVAEGVSIGMDRSSIPEQVET